MQTFRIWVLMALASCAAWSERVGWAIEQQALEALLADARAFGLPEAPLGAPLVTFNSGTAYRSDGTQVPLRRLGFLVQAATSEEPAVVLVGPLRWSPPEFAPVDPAAFDVDGLRCEWWHGNTMLSSVLVTALQCQARGWHELAARLWDHAASQGAGHPRDWFALLPGEDSPKRMLAKTAWRYGTSQLVEPDTDRRQILRNLETIWKHEQAIDDQGLLAQLELTLQPSTAEPGSIEALIDDLVNMSTDRSLMFTGSIEDPHFRSVLLKGFEAVPVLAEYLDDRRLTRSEQMGFNNFIGHICTVGETLPCQRVLNWYEQAIKQGEEDYLVEHVLPKREGMPNAYMLALLAHKYPQRLPELYRKLLAEHPRVESWPMSEAIFNAELPQELKIELFTAAARKRRPVHSGDGLSHLLKIGADEFAPLLIAALDRLPSSPRRKYADARHQEIVQLVLETGDTRVWQALSRAVARADVGLRMEYIHVLESAPDKGVPPEPRLRLLSSLLGDAALRDIESSPKFSGFPAACEFRQVEVRNFAALVLARSLELAARPDPEWTAEQWATLREQVASAVVAELAR